MCRLFGMHTGAVAVPATFWLLDAPDSLSEQSRRNPDGAGIGTFGPHGTPIVSKQPLAAWTDADFACAAHRLKGTTFVAHVRYASTGGLDELNTHPFLQQGRLFAHNGVLFGLPDLDARLASLGAADLVKGQTDSERMFALITAETGRHDGDLGAGITAAISWIAAHLPLYSLNFVLATRTELWALRYPDTHQLYVLTRPAGGTGTHRELSAHSRRISAHAADLVNQAAVMVATERMDDDRGWRPLNAGELVRIGPDLAPISSTPFAAPRHQLSLDDLNPAAAASQHPVSSAVPG
jgi:glutamine amidotransferase